MLPYPVYIWDGALGEWVDHGNLRGVGIQKIEQISSSTDSLGANVIRVTLDDGSFYDYTVRNGDRGPAGSIWIGTSAPPDDSYSIWLNPSGMVSGYVGANQGAENAGRVLAVGEDGVVIPREETPYTLPQASQDALGGVKADSVEETDTQPVRIGGDGKLYTAPGGSGEAVLYTAQSLTEEQQAQARNNIGVRIPFVVTISKDSNGNITADKTFSEIKAAHDAGMTIYAAYKSTMYDLVGYSSDGIASFALNDRYNYIGFTCESSGVEDFWNYYEESLKSLEIFGASAGQVVKVKSVDENGVPTQWEAGDAPGGGGADISLGISGATAGQVAKVKAVDASGAPTAWEAGDAASGGGASEWTLFQEGITDADVSGFEFDGVGDYTEFLFLGSWVKGSGSAGLSVKMNDAFALTVGNYFVHNVQAKNVSVELILMERKRFSLRGLSQQQNSTQYNIDGLGAQSIYNIPQGIETPITKISFYSSTTSVQIPAGATYALYVR